MSTGYRPPSREPKGAWARHLHAFRKERGWSASHAFEEWHEGLHLSRRSRSAYLAIDMGDRQPTPEEARFLISVVGEPPEGAPEPLERPETTDQVAAALLVQAAALDRHTTAITALVLRLESLAGDAIREGVADALREAGLVQDGGGLPASQPPEPLGESPHQ